VLQSLCTTVTVALDSALAHQQQSKIVAPNHLPLSEQIAALLPQARFVLVGTERSLSISLHYLLLRIAEVLNKLYCNQCRLMYESEYLLLEAVLATDSLISIQQIEAAFKDLHLVLTCLNGTLRIAGGPNSKMIQISFSVPYTISPTEAGSLSEREQEILLLLAQGLRDRDIAQQLYISERTVKFHVNNAMVKLQTQTRCQAIYRAMQRGWLGQQ
jgi:DNA-binding CsgD family transcriptional regulator